ncbi:MAG: transposase [Fibrobacteres bacterium]|nr:transposase [Fibrobacterota bacterium]
MERPHGPKRHPKGKFGEAIGYFRNQSVRLRQFLTNARLDLDNNIIERSIRPIAIGRKNWMFAGSGRRRQTVRAADEPGGIL